MRLKRLQLQGYKTFASKTEFVFDDGITAIVGPNGSGKSNVADAVRWVLGEQSFSALRGKRSTDMVFAGSQSRPRAGMAQALLTLDNSDGWLPIDYTEVEIGRRTYRSGDTEYLLNGQKVRLMDITELLATSGLAERTYTIIGQGLVDRALSLRAEERRALFEEAAGIGHYKARRAETLRRLNETQRNLERVHDILSEIRPRLNSLRRQAGRAQDYQQVEKDLRHLLRQYYGFQWERSRQMYRQLTQAAADAQTGWEESRQALADGQQAASHLRQRINQTQQKVGEHLDAREALRDRREQSRRQVAVLAERQQLLTDQLAALDDEMPRLAEQVEAARADLDAALADLEAARAEGTAEQTAFERFNSGLHGQQVEIDKWQQTLEQVVAQQRATRTRLGQAEGQLQQLRERRQEQLASQTSDDERQASEHALRTAEAAVDEAEQAAAARRGAREEVQQARRALRDGIKERRRAHEQAVTELRQRADALARLETRRDLLDQMRREAREVAADVPLVGQLATMVDIPADHRVALEAALRDRLAALVVDDASALWRLLERAGDDQAIRAVAAADVNARGDAPDHNGVTAVLGWASDLVSFEPRWRGLVQALLGHVLLTRDRRAAYQAARELPPGYVAVAPDGFLAFAGGLVEAQPGDPQAGILAREVAFRETTEALETARAGLAALQARADEQAQGIQNDQARMEQLEEKERGLLADEQVAAARLAATLREQDRARQALERWENERAAAMARVAGLDQRIAEAEASLGGLRAKQAQLDDAHQKASAHLQALPVAEVHQQKQAWQQKLAATKTIIAGRQAVVDSRRSTLQQVEGLYQQRQQQQAAIRDQQATLNLPESEAIYESLQAEMEALDAALQPLRAQLTDYQAELTAHEAQLGRLQRNAHELETFFTRAQIKLSQHESHIEGLRERIRADLGLVALDFDDEQTGQTPLPMDDIVEELPQVSELPDDIDASIQRYRGQLRRMGAINPDAPAEFAETQERFDFLTQQLEDLDATEAQLRQVIDELDEMTSRVFAETVERVDQVFGKMFSRLFGGGSAQLVLTEPDELTVSGVDIVARLPSRRQQGLGLLSGGERSLTAAALIFALLTVSPPPFCVMDEVDAMLDEANVNRFRDALRELARDTQFIVITHNRGTVQAAQTVYGISMGTDSASQVLSIKPEAYVNHH